MSFSVLNITYSKHQTIKLILMAFCFLFIIGSYTILKELKDGLFTLIVGYKYLPDVKAISLILMIPMVMFYSFISSKLKRFQLLSFYAVFYGLGSLIIAYFLSDPLIGLNNTVPSYYRVFGWICYLFLEGLSPFLVSLNWSFLNSISKPKDVKFFYIIMAGMGKMGALLFSTMAWLIIAKKISFLIFSSNVDLYVFLFRIGGGCLFIVPILLSILVKKLPSDELKGYTGENEKKETLGNQKSSFGLQRLFSNYYVLSIIGMMLFWEIINVTFNNFRLAIAFSDHNDIEGFSAFLFKSTAITSLISFLFVVIGTNSILRFLGERVGLLLIPLITGVMMMFSLWYKTSNMIIFAWICIRVINLSLTTPIKESLYIPTSREIQFRTKSWIDSFGQKFAKGCGSLYLKVLQLLPTSIVYFFQLNIMIFIVGIWTGLAYYLGKRWSEAIKNKKVIE